MNHSARMHALRTHVPTYTVPKCDAAPPRAGHLTVDLSSDTPRRGSCPLAVAAICRPFSSAAAVAKLRGGCGGRWSNSSFSSMPRSSLVYVVGLGCEAIRVEPEQIAVTQSMDRCGKSMSAMASPAGKRDFDRSTSRAADSSTTAAEAAKTAR